MVKLVWNSLASAGGGRPQRESLKGCPFLPWLPSVGSLLLLLFLCSVFSMVGLSHAQSIPPCINYQTRIANAQGMPFNGTTNLSFSIYTNANIGSAVWGPQVFSNATVIAGYVNAVLGKDVHTNDVTDAFTNGATWVETVVGTTTNETRQQILSVPYAARAGHAWSRAVRTNTAARGEIVLSGASIHETVNAEAFVTNLDVTIETTGRPVCLRLVAQGDMIASVGGNDGHIAFVRGESTLVGQKQRLWVNSGVSIELPPESYGAIDFPSAGRHRYRVMANGGAAGIQFWGIRLMAYEM